MNRVTVATTDGRRSPPIDVAPARVKKENQWVRSLLCTLIALLLAGCAAQTAGPDAAVPSAEEAFAKGKEARAWLATGTNHMFEASDETCRQVIEDLYRLGASEVRVTDGEKREQDAPGEIAATLMAKLPDDPGKRKALLEYEREHSEFPEENSRRDFVEIVFD